MALFRQRAPGNSALECSQPGDSRRRSTELGGRDSARNAARNDSQALVDLQAFQRYGDCIPGGIAASPRFVCVFKFEDDVMIRVQTDQLCVGSAVGYREI